MFVFYFQTLLTLDLRNNGIAIAGLRYLSKILIQNLVIIKKYPFRFICLLSYLLKKLTQLHLHGNHWVCQSVEAVLGLRYDQVRNDIDQ